jgi:PAS domain S-box-containing protein
MPESFARSLDITSVLREMRRAARENGEQLLRLSEQRDAAARRLDDRLQQATATPLELVEELRVRDEELRATVDELAEQLDSVRQAASLLERERAKYVDLFEHAPDAYIVTNLAGVIEEANMAASALFRAEAAFLRGRSLVTFVARGDTDTFRSLLRRLQTVDPGGYKESLRTVVRMRPRGQLVFVAYIHVGVLPAENGRPLVLRWVLRRFDVDAEAGEGSTREALADFAGSVAEELRAPLIPIVEWARSLRDCDVRDEEERRKAIGWIERSAQAQKAKLDELAEFARTYREGPEAHVTDVLEVAEQAANLEGEWSRVLLRLETGSAPLRVLASSLLRALDLLLQRALEGTPRAFKVVLRVRAHAGEVLIDIIAGEGARMPDGWTVRTAIATRIIERCGVRIGLSEGSPSTNLRLPRLPA